LSARGALFVVGVAVDQAPSRDIQILEASEVEPHKLAAFLSEAFSPVFQQFMSTHGDWLHRGPGNRWVALCDGEVAGYRGMTPTVCLFKGMELPAVWAFDLFVLPRFRGLGLQRLLDQALDVPPLLMSFPSDVGAAIYSKQGSGLREDVQVFRLWLAPKPVVPPAPGASALARHLVARSRALGVRGTFRQGTMRVRAVFTRSESTRYRPSRTAEVEVPDPDVLEALFLRHVDRGVATTLRSADHLRWRYLDAPYRSHLSFYLSESHARPTQCAIVRYLESRPEAWVLDIFGDLQDEEGLSDLVRTFLHDAAQRGADEVRVLGSSVALRRVLSGAGFERMAVRKFRWRASDPVIHGLFSSIELQWALGDATFDPRD
jgi:GNAT superfamily N-acetyltransferase